MSKNEIYDHLDYGMECPEVSENIQWRFVQKKNSFIDKPISCIEFNHDGDLLAVGGHNGQVVVYKRAKISKVMYVTIGSYISYSLFQSHTDEFDCLKSLNIDTKINKIRWLQQKHFNNFLLTTNEKTIKLWKLKECDKIYDDYSACENNGEIRFPRIKYVPMGVKATPRRIYKNLHDYHIHSISLNSDQETFLSADDLRINVWNLNVTDRSFNIVNIKPDYMADLNEIITSAEFHPTECNVFAYSTSRGAIRICDMRSSALCEQYIKQIKDIKNDLDGPEPNPLSCIKISPSGRFLMARDYMSLKVYDFRKESGLLEQYVVNDFLRRKLRELYQTERIYDRFECSWSSNEDYIMTGTYNNFFSIFDRRSHKGVMLEAKRERMKPTAILRPCHVSTKLKLKSNEVHVNSLNYNAKIQFTAWHPENNTIAVVAKNDLYIFKDSM